MTLSGPNRNKSFPRHGHSCGFTLVEMLVVIGIITLLLGILLPVVNRAYAYAIRNSMQHDLGTIASALEVYSKVNNGKYPALDYQNDPAIVSANYPGAVLLCWALVAPGNSAQDGNGMGPPGTPNDPLDNAPGFRIPTDPKGTVYGPYLDVEKFHLLVDPRVGVSASTGFQEPNWYLADRYGHPILYFLANTHANIKTPGGYVADWTPASGGNPPRFNLHDNEGNAGAPALFWTTDSSNANALIRMTLMLGDRNSDGMIGPGETAVGAGLPYLLWSAGTDELFGIDLSRGDKTTWPSYVPACDDATNFTQ